MAVSDTLIGTVFDGRYKIVRKLGAGGMADVYLAEDQELGRRVAIKILNDRHAADDPKVAGAVVVERVPNGFGGAVAAPIAKQIMQAILGVESN